MRILIIPCTYTWRNMGDVAMLKATVSRLRAMWPSARIEIPTTNPDGMLAYCPTVSPVHQGDWFAEHYLLGDLHRFLPKLVSDRLVAIKLSIRSHWPSVEYAAIQCKIRLKRQNLDEFESYIGAIENADLIVASGAGGIGDTFPSFSNSVFRVLERAIARGKPTALLSQGFGQIRSPQLLCRAKALLPLVDLIALRERRTGPPLLESMGVAKQLVIVTGDDALEMAYDSRSAELADGLGLNIRTFEPAGLEQRDLDQIRAVILDFASTVSAPIIPTPIARQHNLDARAIQQLLQAVDSECDGGVDLDTPEKVVTQVGRCRVVVTGAYHAAVFALGQGIPAVCLAKSEYFVTKFLGLADLYREGCHVVLLDDGDVQDKLRLTLELAWESAEEVRPALLANSRAQIEKSNEAYNRVKKLVDLDWSSRTECLADGSAVDGAIVAS